jgi:hypothetical protein
MLTYRTTATVATAAALALWLGCAGRGPGGAAAPGEASVAGAAGEAGRTAAGGESTVGEEGAGVDLARALDRALAAGTWDELHIVTECFDRDAFLQVELFGDGVGIWNGERQFALERSELLGLVERFRRAGFAGFKELYGKGEKDAGPPTAALRVICRVALTLDGATKQSVQVSEGRRSPELQALAEKVLGRCREPGAAGVAAADLADGLRKVADGRLAPQTLSLLLHRKPEPEAVAAGEAAFLLRLEGRTLTVLPYRPGAGYGEAAVLELAPEDLSRLAAALIENRAGELPDNLWAEHYTDLVVEVLDREARVQARRFAGMTPATHGEAQRRFDRIYQVLAELARRALATANAPG